ncbi:hypothetical protein GGI12_000097 [Dipsacomyces acuminosporus]|nr:hypothetical protein GGI12_000097 [Dipsacomyces acuminosporus]
MAEPGTPSGFSLPTRGDITHLFRPPKEERQRRWKLFKTYVPDWAIVVLLNAAGGLFGILGPRHREFSLHDRSIRYSHRTSYVPDFVPPLVGYAVPILSALVFLILRRRNWHDFHCTVLGIFLAMGHAYKSVVFFLPLFFATLIAISRTADYHHHWSDVLAGSLMGGYIGWFAYRTYFPPIFSPWVLSDRPYPRRIPKPGKLAHIGTRDGRILPVDEDPYQVYVSGSSSSMQLAPSNSQGNIPAHEAIPIPDDPPYVSIAQGSQTPGKTSPRPAPNEMQQS